MNDLDSAMDSVNAYEERKRQRAQPPESRERVPVGNVDQFFGKLNVAAIKLSAPLRVGDIIEIGTEEEAIRQKVTSMQIDRKDVDEAVEGDDVGIKLNYRVSEGSMVYKISRQQSSDYVERV